VRKIWHMLRRHVSEDFNWGLYLSIAGFLAFSIALNYSINLENGIIDRWAGKPVRMFWYLLLYGTAYYTSAYLTFRAIDKLYLFRTRKFWLWSLAGLSILSLNVGFPYNMQLVRFITDDPQLFTWMYKIVSNLSNFLVNALPLFILAFILGETHEMFGVNRLHVDLSPYLQILLVLMPLIAIASFESGFNNFYPTYKTNRVAEVMNWPEYIPPLIYEIAYGLDFFNVEFMFRGFLVIGMSRLLGKDAIIPMACTYCFLHFGKPIGECVSSIFGGYVLGVIAFNTRNIWGGVVVHIGLAWMMELAAFLQDYIK
jgi:hypothetical protein